MKDTKHYWDKRKDEVKSQVEEEAKLAQSKSARLRRAQKIYTLYATSSHPRERKLAAEAADEIERLEAEITAEENEKWDLETTRRRKEAWNAAVQNSGKKRIIVRNIEKEVGFEMQDLKKHLKRHGLI